MLLEYMLNDIGMQGPDRVLTFEYNDRRLSKILGRIGIQPNDLTLCKYKQGNIERVLIFNFRDKKYIQLDKRDRHGELKVCYKDDRISMILGHLGQTGLLLECVYEYDKLVSFSCSEHGDTKLEVNYDNDRAVSISGMKNGKNVDLRINYDGKEIKNIQGKIGFDEIMLYIRKPKLGKDLLPVCLALLDK